MDEHISYVTNQNYADDYSYTHEKIADVKASLNAHKDEFGRFVGQITSQLKSEIIGIRSEIAMKPTDLQRVEKEIKDQLYLVGMDASNSDMRTRSTDKRLFILEKKLENIELLLKKLAITE